MITSSPVFPIEEFNAKFPVFSENPTMYSVAAIQRAGQEAMLHIAAPAVGMPMAAPETRWYAVFLMTAHILVLDAQTNPDTTIGAATSGGTVFKSTIGSVQIERTKPNSFTTDEWEYWLNQTEYGRRLLAFFDVQAPLGIFLNTKKASVRVLM